MLTYGFVPGDWQEQTSSHGRLHGEFPFEVRFARKLGARDRALFLEALHGQLAETSAELSDEAWRWSGSWVLLSLDAREEGGLFGEGCRAVCDSLEFALAGLSRRFGVREAAFLGITEADPDDRPRATKTLAPRWPGRDFGDADLVLGRRRVRRPRPPATDAAFERARRRLVSRRPPRPSPATCRPSA